MEEFRDDFIPWVFQWLERQPQRVRADRDAIAALARLPHDGQEYVASSGRVSHPGHIVSRCLRYVRGHGLSRRSGALGPRPGTQWRRRWRRRWLPGGHLWAAPSPPWPWIRAALAR